MKRDEVPADMLPVQCLRCGDILAVATDTTQADRNEIGAEHHLWLCANPTANVATLRARSRRILGQDP